MAFWTMDWLAQGGDIVVSASGYNAIVLWIRLKGMRHIQFDFVEFGLGIRSGSLEGLGLG